jgi:hypothetical protein
VTARNDWSSTLPKGRNSFFYPSVSGAFVFSELLKESAVSEIGCLMVSYGQVGPRWVMMPTRTYWINIMRKQRLAGNFGSTVFPLGTVPGYTYGNQIGNPNLSLKLPLLLK